MELQRRLNKIRKSIFIVLAIFVLLSRGNSISYADEVTSASPNYLIILVHGINTTRAVFMGQGENGSNIAELSPNENDYKFGDLKGYLEKELGLKGYVYAYTFSERDGHIDLMANELGNSNWDNKAATIGGTMHHPIAKEVEAKYTKIGTTASQGNSWLEQAREDFKDWYAKQHPPMLAKDVPESIIPNKCIIIAHSLGGPAARSYLSSEYYRGDVAAIITIASQHMGSDSAQALKKMAEYAESGQAEKDSQAMIGLALAAAIMGQTNFTAYCLFSSYYIMNIRPLLDTAVGQNLGWYPAQPGVQDIDSKGSFVADMNSKPFVNSSEPFKVRTIAAYGIPTPNGNLPSINRAAVGLEFLEAFFSANDFAHNGLGVRTVAAFMSLIFGAVANQNGDAYSTYNSQIAAGLSVLNASNIDYKYSGHDFSQDLGETNASVAQVIELMLAVDLVPIPLPPIVSGIAKFAVAAGYVYSKADVLMPEIKYYVFGHGNILKETYQEHLIDQALDGIIPIGGRAQAVHKQAISAASVNSPTASYSAPEQAFVLLSDLDENKKSTGTYHTVTIEAFTEGGSGMSFPIEVNGTKKWVSAVTVKEAPTVVKGVINTFLPKKLKQFQYSENFAAWKPVGAVDEWGNFTIKDLKLAEGQNVIAFDAESWTGNKNNQHLKIVLNTIPMLFSELSPLPGTYTSNPQPTWSGKAAKAAYSPEPLENISLQGAKRINQKTGEEVDVSNKIKITIGGGTYDKYLLFEYTPDEPLPDGEYSIVVTVSSNVGVTQAVVPVIIDTKAPTLAMQEIAPYSPRAPTTIRYTASDEVSPNLLAVRCDLYDSNNNLVTTIATADALPKGENFFQWTGDSEQGTVADGNYKLKIKAFDLAGNHAVAEQPIIIDSTPPVVAGIDVTPNPMTSKTTELGLTAKVNEKSTVIIKLNNTTNNSTTAYLAQSSVVASTASELSVVSYLWKYNDMFSEGPEDGIYRVEVIARDEAGNESEPRTLEAIRIDRTPPKIYGQITSPYVLSNIGKDAYKTTLTYNLSDASSAKVKVYNSNTGQVVDTIPAAPCAEGANGINWNGGDPKFTKGAYKFQIIAEDDVGNIGTAYASCVKDGIAPVISYPVDDNTEVSVTISIRGTAIDPDWTNDKPFKDYRAYYKKDGGDWKTDYVEVPQINRDPKDPKYISIRPLQNNSTLAYLYTNNLENGDYTIKVEVNEENGETLSATRLIKVNNDTLSASAVQSPYIKLRSLPNSIEFKSDDSVKMPLGFINSVKPANVYVEVIKTGTVETPVYYKYFPNIIGAPFIGQPDYKPGTNLGYFLWSDDSGYHFRWSADGSNHRFTGSIVLVGSGSYADIKQIGGGIKVQSPLISWDNSISGGEGGIDFKLTSGQLMITAKVDDDPASPSITADNVYLGVSKFTQQYLPIIIDVAGQRLVSVTNMGTPAESSNLERSTQMIEWNGKLDTGAYPDSGNYIVRVRAEGVDGVGVATDEALVEIKTPFEVSNLKVDPADRKFSTLGGIDRVSLYFNVSKDSLITANVFDSSDKYLATIADGKEVLGTTNPNNPVSLVWRGNFPDPDSGTIVTGGTYKLKLNIAAKDGSGSETKEIDNISVTQYNTNASVVDLQPIGEETPFDEGGSIKTIRLAQGDSPFYYEAKGTGHYHPPKDFSYTLSASGKQKITAYPYVPFAALMHRRFNKVRITVKASAEGTYADSWFSYNPFDGGWKRTGDNYPFSKPRASHDYTLTNGAVSFELSDVAYTNDILGPPTGLNQPSKAFVDLKIPIQFCAQDDDTFVLDTFTIKNDEFTDGTGEARSRLSDKGIFRVTFLQDTSPPQTYGYSGIGTFAIKSQYNQRVDEFHYKYKVKVELASPITYSRLTNRFFPWIGFVNAKNSAHETNDFSGYLDKLDKLGFPGKSYFMGPAAKADDAPHKGSFEAEVFNANASTLASTLKIGGLDIPKPEVTKLNEVVSSKMTGTASDYKTYLSDETLEFIPITSPYGGYFELSNSRVTDKMSLSQQSAYPFVAKTDLTYPYDGKEGAISPFDFSWPWVDKEKSDFDAERAANKEMYDKESGGNPQSYSGPTRKGTWWDLDEAQIAERKANEKTSRLGSGQVRFDKLAGSTWKAAESFGQFLPLPDYVNDVKYSLASSTQGIKVSPASGDKNTSFSAEDLDTEGLAWTTADDTNLFSTNGMIRSSHLTFNDKDFKGKRTLTLASAYTVNNSDYKSANALKFTFLKYDPFDREMNNSPIDNPNVVIDNWEVMVKDKSNGDNKDIVLSGSVNKNDQRLHDTFDLKLNLAASESRYVEILGSVAGPYELMYYDSNSWKTFATSNAGASGHLAWWNVSRLNGKHTVLLRSANFIATRDVQIGTLIAKDGGDAYSTYKRAQLKFPKGAFVNGSKLAQEQLVTITPVSMKEIYIRNRPIIMTSGPIVEIKPSPWKFIVSQEAGIDQRPTLRFLYTFDELKELGVWNGEGTPSNIPWNIHQVTAAGDLQIVSDNKQETEVNNGENQYAFYAPLDHFSTYALLSGKFKLSAPIVFADRYITNKDTVTIYGTAEPGSVLTLYIKTENVIPEIEKGEPYAARINADDKTGNYKFENIKLLQEGNNYIYVTSHQGDEKEVRTYSDVTIIKDTVPPKLKTIIQPLAFSPNADGKMDEVVIEGQSDKKGKICLQLMRDGAPLLGQEMSQEAGEEVKAIWTGDSFALYRRQIDTSAWQMIIDNPLTDKLYDGNYLISVYAIDQAGNISENNLKTVRLDTTPPILTASSTLKKFSPDGNGKFDKATFKSQMNEAGVFNLQLTTPNLQQAVLFKEMVIAEKDTWYKYNWDNAALEIVSQETVVKTIPYFNNLGDGLYTFEVFAVDEVENSSAPATFEVIVDLTPPKLLSFSATPEIFSPNGDGRKDITQISWQFNEASIVSLEVAGGYLRLPDVTESYREQGNYTWDGTSPLHEMERGAGVRIVPDGLYYLKLFAEDDVGNSFYSDPVNQNIAVEVDTQPPVCEIGQNLFGISPNGDGKYDRVDFSAKSDEKGNLNFSLGSFISFEGAIGSEKEIQLAWDGLTQLNNEIMKQIPVKDDVYNYSAYTIDLAGNKSKVVTGEIVVDTQPPIILEYGIEPNPFTPNGDGVKDTAKFEYKFSEPVYTRLGIFDENGKMFRANEGPTENYQYATAKVESRESKVESRESKVDSRCWEWDGRGSHNELLGGTYTYSILAEDWVGNRVSSEAKNIIVDAIPSLIPYAFAEPDPFAPVNPNNNFTEIKYYLGRDNLKVKIAVVGEGSKPIKTLLNEVTQNKGEHSVKWVGDYDSDYTGAKAEKDPTRVNDASYEFKIIAVDPDGGNPGEVSSTVLVDNIPPYIMAKPIQIDYKNQKASLNYSIPETASVEVAVYDYKDNLAAKILAAQKQAAGEYKVNWNPETSQSGQYYFKISAIDRAQNYSEIKTELFAVAPQQTLQIANLSIAPNPFTPNGDSHTDLAKITYKLAGGVPGYKVSLHILNPTGATIRKLIEDESQTPGTYSFYWDGLSDNKQPAADGYYECQIIAEDTLGEKVESKGSILAIPTRPTVDLSVHPSIFSPNGDGANDTAAFNYSIDYPLQYVTGDALVKIEVFNSTNEAVWSKIFNHTAGSYIYQWDGKDANQQLLKSGQYYVKISAEDALGSTALPKTALLEANYNAPAADILSVAPNPFSPNGDGVKDQVVISHSLSKPASVSIAIQGANNQVIRKLASNQMTDAYLKALAVPTVSWDGKDENGKVVADGDYNLRIFATDEAGNKGETAQVLTVDNASPVVPQFVKLKSHANQSTQTLTGTAEPQAQVLVISAGTTFEGKADNFGHFSIPINLSLGENAYKVLAVDAAGNASDHSILQTIQYETDAPQISKVKVFPGLAKIGTVTISFEVSETLKADPIVQVNKETATLSQKFPSGYEYIYTVTDKAQQGAASISIEASDLAGNQTSYHSAGLLAIDTLAPAKPQVNALPAYVNADKLVVSGEAETKAIVKIFNNELPAGQATAGGGFSKEISLEAGSNSIYVLCQDAAGNVSEKSNAQTVVLDKTLPSITIKEISPDPAKAGAVYITFEVSEDLINIPSTLINNFPAAYVSKQGKQYTYNYTVGDNDQQGSAKVEIQGKDLAGNAASKIVSFTIDTIKPEISNLAMTPNPAKAGVATMTFEVSEALKTNPMVKINKETATFSRWFPIPSGWGYEYVYNVSSQDQQGTAAISIEAVDPAGNLGSAKSDILTIDTVPPVKPIAIALPSYTNQASQVVEGTAEAGSGIRLYNHDALVAKTIAKENGKFSITADLAPGSNEFKLTAEDAAGNVSEISEKQTVVYDTGSPVFSGVKISPDPAKAGAVYITFEVSEDLLDFPLTKVNGSPATYVSKQGNQYTYNYTIGDNDQQGSAKVEIQGKDLAGNAGSKTASFTIDTIKPEVSNITATPAIAKVGTVTLSFDVSEELKELPTTTVNGLSATYLSKQGKTYTYNYKITDKDQQGTAVISIEAVDSANNTGYGTAENLAIDTIAPAKPTVDTLPGYTNQQKQKVSGKTEAKAKLKILDNEKVVAQAAADSEGKFSGEIELELGSNSLSVISEDSAGNISASSDSQTVEFDTNNPVFSSVTISPDPAKEGDVAINFVSSKKLKEDPVVKVKDKNAKKAKKVKDSMLEYQYTYTVSASDQQGLATVEISGADLAGNAGSKAASFTIDTIKPEVSNITVTPAIAKVGTVTLSFDVSEELKEPPTTTVNSLPATCLSQQGGKYTYYYLVGETDQQGSAAVSIEAKDFANNVGHGTSDLLTIDTVAPDKPTINKPAGYVNEEKMVISGEAEDGSAVKIYKDEILVGETTAKNGFSKEITLDLGSNSIHVACQDAAGNISEKSEVQAVILDKTPPVFVVKGISPDPAKAGAVYVTFEVSEVLKEDPTVKINSHPSIIVSLQSKTYMFKYNVTDQDEQGSAKVEIDGKDLAGNVGSKTASFTIDTIKPEVSNVIITPQIAKAGTVAISFDLSEELKELPTTTVNGLSATYLSKTGKTYTYNYKVTDQDEQGSAKVEIDGKDLAGNAGSKTANFTIDTIKPEVSNVIITPPIAKAGIVTLSFDVSEELKELPTASVNGLPATYISKQDNKYTYHYSVTEADQQGSAVVLIKVVDLADNPTAYQANDLLTIDTISPAIAKISIAPAIAKVGSAAINFAASEALLNDPIVKVNGNLATKDVSSSGLDYKYNYAVAASDQQGAAVVSVAIADLAKNEVVKSYSDLLSIDTLAPTVSNVSVSPALAKACVVTIGFEVSEDLLAIPLMEVNGLPASYISKIGNKYAYNYTVTDKDQQNAANISIEISDLAKNEVSKSYNDLLSIDTVKPGKPLLSKLSEYTNQDNLIVSGSAESASTVKLCQNALEVVSGKADSKGDFSLQVTLTNGNNNIYAAATDAAGNTSLNSDAQVVVLDKIPPAISGVEIKSLNSKTKYAKLGDTVAIDFDVSEDLTVDPDVVISGKAAVKTGGPTKLSATQISYKYQYTVVAAGPDGETTVALNIEDKAGNKASSSASIVIDKAVPEISNISVSKNPANAGALNIDFTVSDPTSGLKELPAVEVTQKGANTANGPVSLLSGNNYQATYSVVGGYDGTAGILIKATDKALNANSSSSAFEVDTKAPTFSNVTSTVTSNPDFSKDAKAGAEVVIQFESSETLKSSPAPAVKVNGNTAALDSSNGNKYSFKYMVSGNDTNGQAVILINGYDPAGNYGEYSTSKASESFMIDVVSPKVEKADLIANPPVFATNTDPDPSSKDTPGKTTLYYKTTEYGLVTVKVYKVTDGQTNFTKADFSAGNLVKTLVNGSYLGGGAHEVTWDGSGYTVPGMYAFIVEVKDKAGNVTEKKWGGTVWIQNNVLTLKDPDQKNEANNPDPKVFSPKLKNTTLYFYIDLSLNPANTTPAQWIEAMKVEKETKKVGKYSVKVYSDANLTKLARTIVSGADAWAATKTSEEWDGKNDAGQLVADGTYYLVVDVKDFAGDPAKQNLLKHQVTVDNTDPVISDVSVSPYYFSPGNTNSGIKATTLAYAVSDNSGKVKATIEALKGNKTIKTLLNGEEKNNGSYSQSWDGGGSDNQDGKYKLKVSVVDEAGNATEGALKEVEIDTKPPEKYSMQINRADDTVSEYTNSASVKLKLSAADDNLDQMRFSNDGSSWSGWESFGAAKDWTLTAGDGIKTVYVQYQDKAGNWAQTNDTITLDKTAPAGALEIKLANNAAGEYTNSESVNLSLSVSEVNLDKMRFSNDGLSWSAWEAYASSKAWELSAGDALKTVYVQYKDKADNINSEAIKDTITLDKAPPSAPAVAIDPGLNASGWSKNAKQTFIWPEVVDNGQKCTYQIKVDSDEKTSVSSGWSKSFGDGNHTIKIWSIDAAGNPSASPYEKTFGIDTEAPYFTGINFSLAENTWSSNPSITCNYSATDAGSGCETSPNRAYIDGEFWGKNDKDPNTAWDVSNISSPWTFTLPDGEHDVKIEVEDKAGLSVFSKNYHFKIDTTPPAAPAVSVAGDHTPLDTWSKHNTPLFTWGIVGDWGGSGVSKYRGFIDGVDQGEVVSGWHPTLADGLHSVYIKAVDAAGNSTASSTFSFKIDTTPPKAPSVKIEHSIYDTGWTNHTSPYFTWTWSDVGDENGTGSGIIIYRAFIDGANQGWITSPWHPTLNAQGTYKIYLQAEDKAGNTKDSPTYTICVDTVAPVISQPDTAKFNPYLCDGGIVKFSAYDPAPSSGFIINNVVQNMTGNVKAGETMIRSTIPAASLGNNNYQIIWDGKNDAGDYVNEGNYILEINGTDGAGNYAKKTSTLALRDDQRITNNDTNSNSPSLTINGNNLTLRWLEGGADDSLKVMAQAYVGDDDWGNDWTGPYGDKNYADKEDFTLDSPQVLEVNCTAINEWAPSEYHAIKRKSDNAVMWDQKFTGEDDGSKKYFTPIIPAGKYYAYVYINDEYNGGAKTYAFTKVWYKDLKYNQYICYSNDLGKAWYGTSGPEKVDSYSVGPNSSGDHSVKAEGSHIYYKRGNSGWVKITSITPWSFKADPWVIADNSGNAYVAWMDDRDGNDEIYFQIIPEKFAPIKGTVTAAKVKTGGEKPVTALAATLEAPVLIAPDKGKTNVQTLRPTFEWKHRRNSQLTTNNYQLDIAKNDAFSIAHQTFSKSPGAGSPDKADASLCYYNYSIHEFDPGLERDTDYYWKVTALSTGEAATSETWSFRVQPDLTISGVTNYPNPFNPDREKTKIRYRLSADADEVIIRIYDIAGSLVNELTGTTQGEGSSVWNKYNDVEWDGRNGRGSVVYNGIYPFEITARVGSRTVSARGKAAVLK